MFFYFPHLISKSKYTYKEPPSTDESAEPTLDPDLESDTETLHFNAGAEEAET